MTCKTCKLVKSDDTRQYFIPNRSGHCRGCYMAVYHNRGYIGQRLVSRANKKIKEVSLKIYAHNSELTGRDFTRERVRQRDNHTCQNCGKLWRPKTRRLDVHHLEGLCGKLSKNYDKIETVPKLITLCHKCHYSHHQFSKRITGEW